MDHTGAGPRRLDRETILFFPDDARGKDRAGSSQDFRDDSISIMFAGQRRSEGGVIDPEDKTLRFQGGGEFCPFSRRNGVGHLGRRGSCQPQALNIIVALGECLAGGFQPR